MAVDTKAPAAWYRALTLSERLALLRRAGTAAEVSTAAGARAAQLDAELAERRLGRWRGVPALAPDGLFERRLAADGLTAAEFRQLLGEPVEALRDRWHAGAGLRAPDWLAEIDAVLARLPDPPLADDGEAPGGEDRPEGFVDAFAPFIRPGVARLQAGIAALRKRYPRLPVDPATIVPLLYAKLPPHLFEVVSRTLVLELNVARLQGCLDGETPEARFRGFLHRLRHREHLTALLAEYPVLARQVVSGIDRWLAFSLEFLTHLAIDADAVRATFSPDAELGVIESLQGGLGDRHRSGRSVLIAGFTSGRRVVYKPRPLAADAHFQALLAWLNARGADPAFRTLTVLDRGDHGWVEFVSAAGCDTEAGVRRFYRRQGGQLAVLHALAATDFHFENLMAAGEHPVLLDLEALVQPVHHATEPGDGGPYALAFRALHDSVYGTGLLPQRLWANGESAGIDISGLSAVAGQLTPQRVPVWAAAGTDEMRIERRRMPLAGGQNRPAVGGAEVGPLDYVAELTAGFSHVYGLLAAHRDELLAPAGPIERFASDEVRVVLRPTQHYSTLLHDSYHPDVLRDALDRDRHFDRLWEPVAYQARLATLVPFERRDLEAGDIPMFTTRADSRDLHGTGGVMPGFFAESGLEHVRRRVAGLDDADLARQLWLIRTSLATLSGAAASADAPSIDAANSSPWFQSVAATNPAAINAVARPAAGASAERPRLVLAARAIGHRLAALAIRGRQDVGWIGLKLEREHDWSLAPMALDLYDGLAGVAFFLNYLAVIDRAGGHAELAEAALATLVRAVEASRNDPWPIGAFSGWGGIMYTLTHLGALLDRPALLGQAAGLLDTMLPLIERDETFDVISGAAGAIGALTALNRVAPSPRHVEAVRRCAEHLVARATPQAHGIGWPLADRPALLGFSHGAAGQAWALLEAAALTGEPRFRQAALGAIAYERSLFAPERGNWPDLRPPDEAPATQPPASSGAAPDHAPDHAFMLAWCHGAPGVGLGRVAALRHLDDTSTRAEIDAALTSTLAGGFGHNHSLCHGDLGNLELVAEAAETLDPDRWRGPLAGITTALLDDLGRRGPRCGNLLGAEAPDLMTGLAGIGYGLLRLAEPARVPSILRLAPPVG